MSTAKRPHPVNLIWTLSRKELQKVALLSSWFFLVITALWLLKPLRQASLLAHLGSTEIPYVRLAAVGVVAVVVASYSRVVDRFTRVDVARGTSLLFSMALVAFWLALTFGGEALGAQRWFVWSVFILVDIYATVMVGLFWTYANDVVLPAEADRLYGPIGLGGILGGVAGGSLVDLLVGVTGHVNLLLVCAGLGVGAAALAWITERTLQPPPRAVRTEPKTHKWSVAFDGFREVARSRYLMLIVGIVIGYEFAAAMTDFVVSVIFERSFSGQDELAKMFGRLGWIVSLIALACQLLLVPILLPRKRIALMVPPIAMAIAAVGLAALPLVWVAIVLSAADRGLNYSLQQVTKETLYVPLTDAQKYKAKALIDMVIDRTGKALSSLALMTIIAASGVSITISLTVALAAVMLWGVSAHYLGRAYAEKVAERAACSEQPAPPRPANVPPVSTAPARLG